MSVTGGVSVVVPAYNAAPYVGEALESVLGQTFRDVEVIVVNDGSTDDTAGVVRRFGTSVIYAEQPNGGPARARNAGLALATREYVAFLDADDAWVPTKLEEQMACLRAHPDAALVYSQMVNFREADGVVEEPYPRTVHSGWLFDRLLVENFIPLPSVVLPAELVRRVGGFDETLLTAEDTNLYLRVAMSHPFVGLERPLVRRRLHDTNLSRRPDVPVGTLRNLDRIVEQFPAKAPDRYPPMQEAYRRRGRALQRDCFYVSRYREAAAVGRRFSELGIDDREVMIVGWLSRLPGPMLDGGRALLRRARRAARFLLRK